MWRNMERWKWPQRECDRPHGDRNRAWGAIVYNLLQLPLGPSFRNRLENILLYTRKATRRRWVLVAFYTGERLIIINSGLYCAIVHPFPAEDHGLRFGGAGRQPSGGRACTCALLDPRDRDRSSLALTYRSYSTLNLNISHLHSNKIQFYTSKWTKLKPDLK